MTDARVVLQSKGLNAWFAIGYCRARRVATQLVRDSRFGSVH